ncbi:unnamed protein product [Cunninghamella blakesleeana]
MNRLPFKLFHSSHFNSNSVNQWSIYLQSLQQQQQQYHSIPIVYPHTQPIDSLTLNPNENEQNEDSLPEENQQLSKEAIAIFEFSEAYSKQQNIEKENLEKNKPSWILDEYNDYHDNGVEVPATSLVIISNRNKNNSIATEEHLLNSAYLQTCHQNENESTLILWPVVPLRL